jgi:hypothetical protein
MPKHGEHDAEMKLPDNRMVSRESGINVWLQQAIIDRLGNEQGEAIIHQAETRKKRRDGWLLWQMKERGHTDLVEEYQQRERQAIQEIDFTNWEGHVTAKNIDLVREALCQRMTTRHVALDAFTLFTKDDLSVGDYVKFTSEQVELHVVYSKTEVKFTTWQIEKD